MERAASIFKEDGCVSVGC